MSKSTLALSFVLSRKEVSTVIPGFRNPDHVHQNTSGLKKLNKEMVSIMQSLYESHWKPVVDPMGKVG